MLNATNIPSARVPLIDERTGLIAREWFAFFQNLFYLTGGGGNDTTLMEVQYPPAPDVAETLSSLPVMPDEVALSPLGTAPVVDTAIGLSVETLASLLAIVEAVAIAPSPQVGQPLITDTTLVGDGTAASPLSVATTLEAVAPIELHSMPTTLTGPITIIADYTIQTTDKWLINDKAAACVLTFPPAAICLGRALTVQNYQLFAVTSATANIVPLGGGSAGTAVLLPIVGSTATIVSNGVNWVIMQ